MIINHGKIEGDNLVLSSSKGFTLKLETLEKYKDLDALRKPIMIYQGGAIKEAPFKTQDDLVVFYVDASMPISHFNTNLRCFEIKYSEDRSELMILGKVDPYSMTLPTINIFKKIENRYHQQTFRIQFDNRLKTRGIKSLGIKPVAISGKRTDGYMLVSPKSDKVLMNTSTMPRLLIVPPGITEDEVKKNLRYTFKDVCVVPSTEIEKYAASAISSACYFFGYTDAICRRVRVIASLNYNQNSRKNIGFSPDQIDPITGQIQDEAEDGSLVVIGQVPTSDIPDGEPESLIV